MDRTVKVKVFLPTGVCSCSYVGFLGRIYSAVRKYSDIVDYYEDTADSPEARALGITYRGVVVGSRVLTGNVTEEQIEEAILAEIGAEA